jgi:hypothetical protein
MLLCNGVGGGTSKRGRGLEDIFEKSTMPKVCLHSHRPMEKIFLIESWDVNFAGGALVVCHLGPSVVFVAARL